MKIYFAGSIRGGREDANLYMSLIDDIKRYGTVLTEHIGDATLSAQGEQTVDDTFIYTRDMDWVRESDAIIAEVTTASLGVGYELGQAESMGKPILCLYRPQSGKRLSAMLSGNVYMKIKHYNTLDEAKDIIKDFISTLNNL
jgi:2'-deoxynucleoside 5'-phosphate N-hydrolase